MAILFILGIMNTGVSGITTNEICRKETFNADCTHNEIIVMKTAFYGLMANGRCWPLQDSNTGCYDNVLNYFDTHCSGKRTCSIDANDPEIDDLAISCPQHLSPYLEVSYNCAEGMYIFLWKIWGPNSHYKSCIEVLGLVVIAISIGL